MKTEGQPTKEQLFIEDLVQALLAHAKTAQTDLVNSQGAPTEAFNAGVVQGYWQVLSSLIARMKLHELDLDQYHVDGFDPDSIWTPVRNGLRTKKGPSGSEPR